MKEFKLRDTDSRTFYIEADGWQRDRLGVHFYRLTDDTYKTLWQRLFKPGASMVKRVVVFYIANSSLGSFEAIDTPADLG